MKACKKNNHLFIFGLFICFSATAVFPAYGEDLPDYEMTAEIPACTESCSDDFYNPSSMEYSDSPETTYSDFSIDPEPDFLFAEETDKKTDTSAGSSTEESLAIWGACTVSTVKNVEYNGEPAQPPVSIKTEEGIELEQDKDYTVSYKDNLEPGTGKIILNGLSELCQGELSLDFSICLSAPIITSVKSTDYETVKISWNPVIGADSYTLYYKTKGQNDYQKVKAGLKNTSFVHRSRKGCPLIPGEKYLYTVRAVRGKMKSEPASALPVTPKIETVKLKSVKPVSYNSVKITWNNVKGADGYFVYYKSDKDSWKKLAEVKKSTEFFFTGNKKYPLKTGVPYQYSVRAYHNINGRNYFGDHTAKPKSAKTIPDQVKLTGIDCLGESKIDLWWAPANGADYYVIYRMNPAGKWVEIGSVSASSQPHYLHLASKKHPIKKDHTYKYTVQAYSRAGNTPGRFQKKGLTAEVHPLTESEIRAKIYARRIVNKITNDQMSKREKLIACFDWVKEHPFRADHIISYQRGWTGDFANDIFEEGSGECIAYGCAFAYLAKALGYQKVRAATTSRPNAADIHGWAEIGGKVYDPSLARHVGDSYFFNITYQAFGYDIGAAKEIY